MATSNHRGLVTLGTRPKPRFSWLGLIGFGLLLALLGVALVQARQFALLKQAVRTGDDFVVLTVYQVEIKAHRMSCLIVAQRSRQQNL